ncbi:glycerophosphodiester phosphodiesterase [Citrobacter freundii]|nr:glycerophosphodiester phosphodiesterase [Citrobacter freundii]
MTIRYHSNLLTSIILCSSFTAVAGTPSIIAHRGGTGDGPENTEYVIQKSLDNHADAVWVTAQLSRDNVIVLYRPSDLSTLTNMTGAVSAWKVSELIKADAAYRFAPPSYPLRDKGIAIPSLQAVLKKWPQTFFFIDIKSPDASPQQFASTLLKTLSDTHSLDRVRVYSTDERYLNVLPKEIPRFESRDRTRTALANITMNHSCPFDPKINRNKWYGFELKREVSVTEKFTLGEGVSRSFLKWDTEAFRCFKQAGNNKIILFGINTSEDYQQAKSLGADGVLVDSTSEFKKHD